MMLLPVFHNPKLASASFRLVFCVLVDRTYVTICVVKYTFGIRDAQFARLLNSKRFVTSQNKVHIH